MNVSFLSEDIVIDLHNTVIENYGGKEGFKDDNIAATLNRIHTHIHYGNLDKNDVFHIAAKYATVISQAHNFIDGNKRTDFLSMVTFLVENNIAFKLKENENISILEKLAKKELTEVECEEWLKNSINNHNLD